MAQTSVSLDMTAGFAGQVVDSGLSEIISRVVSTKQLDIVSVSGDESDGDYAILIDGVAVAEFTASSSTAAQIVAGLIADFSSSVATIEASGTEDMLIESINSETSYTVTVSSPSSDLTTSNLQAAGQELPYGVGVVADPRAAVSGEQCRLPRLTGEVTAGTFLGITKCDTMRESNSGNGYTNFAAVSILRKGRIKVQVEDAVAEGGQVFCRFTDPSTSYGLGSFRSDADTSDAVAVPGAMFLTAASANGLAVVELNPTR